eukprot:EG_transcript_32652
MPAAAALRSHATYVLMSRRLGLTAVRQLQRRPLRGLQSPLQWQVLLSRACSWVLPFCFFIVFRISMARLLQLVIPTPSGTATIVNLKPFGFCNSCTAPVTYSLLEALQPTLSAQFAFF